MSNSVSVKVDMNIPGAVKNLRTAAWGAAKQTAVAIETDIKGGGPHSIATSMKIEGKWIPSAPGEPPHLRSGNLRRSYHVEFDEPTLTAKVGSDPSLANYAAALEIGTRHMAARPHLLPALLWQGPMFAQRITAALKKMSGVSAGGTP